MSYRSFSRSPKDPERVLVQDCPVQKHWRSGKAVAGFALPRVHREEACYVTHLVIIYVAAKKQKLVSSQISKKMPYPKRSQVAMRNNISK
ncbi:hypothetical protein TNCV_2576331 [Trichonephila clavipes]|uniref:Uncharacterized protein n=1 Tax=Trichonephila clavipes TaxID=2585209 RepID=A0A8X6RBY3_TRICX|nr:hypothetical protein TNCV_2576331 [Trichonephila clavipes]